MTRTQEHLTLFLNEVFNGNAKEEVTSFCGYVIYSYSFFTKEKYYVFHLGNTPFFTNSDIHDSRRELKQFFDFLSYKWVFFNMTNKDWFYVKDNRFSSSPTGNTNYYYFYDDRNSGILYKDWESFKEFMSI